MGKFLVLVCVALLAGCGDPMIEARLEGHWAGLASQDARCLAELPRPGTLFALMYADRGTVEAYRNAYVSACMRKHSGREARDNDTWEQNVESK